MPARGRETSAGNDNRLNVTAFNGKAVTERSERSMPRTYGNMPRNTRQRGQKRTSIPWLAVQCRLRVEALLTRRGKDGRKFVSRSMPTRLACPRA